MRLSEQQLAALRLLIEEEPSGPHAPGEYPIGRERDDWRPSLITTRFCRYESTNGYVVVNDAYTQVIEFSSLPDSIEVWVLDNNIEIQFLSEIGGRNESITLNAGNFYEPGIVYRSLVARNLVAAAVGRIQVVAKWSYR